MAGSRYRVLEKPSQAFYGLDDNIFFVYLLSLTVNLARFCVYIFLLSLSLKFLRVCRLYTS